MSVLEIGLTASTLAPVPDPAHKDGLKVTLQDIDASNAGRSANGRMIRSRVVGGADAKRKLDLKWPPMTSAETSQLLQAISAEYVWVKYPDPYTGGLRTAEFYASDRAAPVYSVIDGKPLWESVSFNLIER